MGWNQEDLMNECLSASEEGQVSDLGSVLVQI